MSYPSRNVEFCPDSFSFIEKRPCRREVTAIGISNLSGTAAKMRDLGARASFCNRYAMA